jgi:hypothetical protein
MITEKVLHEDHNGKKIILHIEFDEDGKEKDRWVTYERYPDRRYDYLTAEQAAEKILKGKGIEYSYIEKLSVDALKDAEEEFQTGNFTMEGEVEFEDKKHEGPLLKKSIICSECLISNISFFNLIINGDVDFFNVTISNYANFMFAKISRNAYFRYATINGNTSFVNAKISGNAYFGDAKISGDAIFWSATIRGDAYFGNAFFLKASFQGTRFEKLCDMSSFASGEINLSGTIFVENLLLSSYSDNDKLIEKHEQTRQVIDKEKEKLKEELKEKFEETFEDYTLKKLDDLLQEWQDSGRGIHSINFDNTLIQGELRCSFKDIRPLKGVPVVKPHQEKNWVQAQRQYSWLKEQYRKQGAYEDEDKAHICAMDCKYKNHKFLGFLYKQILGYGVNPLIVARAIGIVLLLFSFIFCIANYTGHILTTTEPVAFGNRYFDSLYFSVITFATVGYGDVRAIGWAACFAMLEGLLGIVLNAALVVVIFRKLIR